MTCRIKPCFYYKKLERAKGFEPSTPTLARSCSTPELRPLERLKLGLALQRARYCLTEQQMQ